MVEIHASWLVQDEVPQDWKTVTVPFVKGCKEMPVNYRPVSMTSTGGDSERQDTHDVLGAEAGGVKAED